jgi:hypothetical protein
MVREMLAANKFESFEEHEAEEWLRRREAVFDAGQSKEASRLAKSARNAAWVAAIAAILSAIVSLWPYIPGVVRLQLSLAI